MDIESTLRRSEEEYRKTHGGKRPKRIVIGGEYAEQLADLLCKRRMEIHTDLEKWINFDDEDLISGKQVLFKGIPVIAILDEDEELVIK